METASKAAMESLVEKQDPSFKITIILIGLVILYALSLPLATAFAELSKIAQAQL
jgi:ATP-dependent Zn protease